MFSAIVGRPHRTPPAPSVNTTYDLRKSVGTNDETINIRLDIMNKMLTNIRLTIKKQK